MPLVLLELQSNPGIFRIHLWTSLTARQVCCPRLWILPHQEGRDLLTELLCTTGDHERSGSFWICDREMSSHDYDVVFSDTVRPFLSHSRWRFPDVYFFASSIKPLQNADCPLQSRKFWCTMVTQQTHWSRNLGKTYSTLSYQNRIDIALVGRTDDQQQFWWLYWHTPPRTIEMVWQLFLLACLLACFPQRR